MANNKKFDINEYIHIGYENYDLYISQYGGAADDAISKDANKYLKLIIDKYNIILDEVEDVLDIHSKSTIQKRIVPILKAKGCLYIVKPVRDLLYAYMGESQYLEAYNKGLAGVSCPNFYSNIHEENIKLLKDSKIKKTWLRKKLFFSEECLTESIKEIFSKEVIITKDDKEVVIYEDLTVAEINKIIKKKVVSENKIREKFKLLNGLQVKRRISKGEIILNFRIVMTNEGKRSPLVRYSISNKI